MTKDLFKLEGKTCLITGAASGLGRNMVEYFAQAGAKLILSDINEEQGLELTQALNESGAECRFIQCDLGRRPSVDALITQALSRDSAAGGCVDVLICCGGMEGHVGSLSDASEEDWDQLMTVNLKSTQWLTAKIAPHMAKRKEGRIILVSSIAGLRGNKAIGCYGIAKAALSQLARNLAVEWGPNGVTVNTIAPGLIETPFSEKLKSNVEFMQRRMSLTPLRRMGRPQEITGVAAMLASEAGGFITGQTLVVDGGTLISDGN